MTISSTQIWLLLFVTVGYGLIGFLDDFIKVVKKRNLGLTSKQKLLGQMVIAILVYFGLRTLALIRPIRVPGNRN